MSHKDPDSIRLWQAATQQKRESEQDKRHEWCPEINKSKEIHHDHRVPPTPHIDDHEGEGGGEEGDVEGGPDEEHQGAAEEEHVEEVGGAAEEALLLKDSEVAGHEEHVEHKVNVDRAKVKEIRKQSPELTKLL